MLKCAGIEAYGKAFKAYRKWSITSQVFHDLELALLSVIIQATFFGTAFPAMTSGIEAPGTDPVECHFGCARGQGPNTAPTVAAYGNIARKLQLGFVSSKVAASVRLAYEKSDHTGEQCPRMP